MTSNGRGGTKCRSGERKQARGNIEKLEIEEEQGNEMEISRVTSGGTTGVGARGRVPPYGFQERDKLEDFGYFHA